MAREGAGDVPDNDSGQGINSSSTYTHVQGAYGAHTGAVGGAADGTRRGAEAPLNMGIRAGTGKYLSWTILRDDPSTFPSHGNNSGAHGEPYSKV